VRQFLHQDLPQITRVPARPRSNSIVQLLDVSGVYQPATLLTDGTLALAKSYNSLPPGDPRYIIGLHRPSYHTEAAVDVAGRRLA
jgi:hypothetical protein